MKTLPTLSFAQSALVAFLGSIALIAASPGARADGFDDGAMPSSLGEPSAPTVLHTTYYDGFSDGYVNERSERCGTPRKRLISVMRPALLGTTSTPAGLSPELASIADEYHAGFAEGRETAAQTPCRAKQKAIVTQPAERLWNGHTQ